MPLNAAAAVKPDYILPVAEMALKMPEFIWNGEFGGRMKTVKDKGTKPESKRMLGAKTTEKLQGPPSVYVCPDCNGPLWEINSGRSTLYRCLVGHAFAPKALDDAQTEEVERSLWLALRALEERVRLQEQLANRAEENRNARTAGDFRSRATANAKHAAIVRKMLEDL
jgi:two-component system chemotaxis response regulator CheB